MRIQVRDFMNSPVMKCTLSTDVGKVLELMRIHRLSALPVVDIQGNQVEIKGIITIRDMSEVVNPNEAVEQFMSDRVSVVHPDSSAQSAAQMMIKKGVHHLVVMEEGAIVGILSSSDFVKLVSEYQLED